MRMIFGVLSLLIVLAIIGMVGAKQFEALGLMRGASVSPATGAQAVAGPDSTVAAQARSIQSNVRDAAKAALQSGADRAASQP